MLLFLTIYHRLFQLSLSMAQGLDLIFKVPSNPGHCDFTKFCEIFLLLKFLSTLLFPVCSHAGWLLDWPAGEWGKDFPLSSWHEFIHHHMVQRASVWQTCRQVSGVIPRVCIVPKVRNVFALGLKKNHKEILLFGKFQSHNLSIIIFSSVLNDNITNVPEVEPCKSVYTSLVYFGIFKFILLIGGFKRKISNM